MSIEAVEAVIDLIEMGAMANQEDIVKCLRSAIEQAERQEPVAGYRWEEGRIPPSVTYTAPPQREWQGLTEGETIDLALSAFQLPEVSFEARLKIQNELVKAMNEPDSRLMIFAATIEAKLKEKNG